MFRLLLVACLILPMPALAQPAEGAPLRRLLTADDLSGWEAVGRINVQGAGYCTGTLVAPTIVLTAAHCVYHPVSGRQVTTDRIHFVAGWRNGEFIAHRRVTDLDIPQGYIHDKAPSRTRISNDLAVLTLDDPIDQADVLPMSVATGPARTAPVAVVSYGKGRAQVPSLQDPCHFLGRGDGILLVSCAAVPGTSGAPILQRTDGGWSVIGVISASSGRQTYGVDLFSKLKGTLTAAE